jgi:hypothetical protein
MAMVIGEGDGKFRMSSDFEGFCPGDYARDVCVGCASKTEGEDCSFEANHLR